MSIEDSNDAGEEHDNWDQWYAGSPLYPILDWEWRGMSGVQYNAESGDGVSFSVNLMNDEWWFWGRVDKPGFVPNVQHGPFSSWEIAAKDCEENNVNR